MATATVTEFITRTVNTTAPTATSDNRATPQGGVFEHVNPSHYDPSNPIVLFIIQASIVIILTRIIHFPLTYIRQPRVIAEVITGILLGPSVMGRIPGFTAAIFPSASLPVFNLAANLGLILFLFLVGLEVDLRYLLSNWKIALSVGALGMAVPFGLGAAIAWGLYHQFRDDDGIAHIDFGIYLLFIGIAMAITAFPVLCRILTSLSLLTTPVGVIVLSAGVGNDVVGWILLALCVALVNSGAGLTALWILMVSVGYCLFLAFVIRPAFMWVLRRTGSLSNGPTQTVVALTVLLVLASSFFTAIIGIHAIFGAFMVGLICPHDGGFAIKLTEKIEDLVGVLFLPLYFALSGLRTDLGLLDSGITWGYVVGVCAIAFFGKVFGGTMAARLNGLVWRESLTIGCLMSCKGLVELIVLNIGLQARILSTRTFTIFVVMALVTTFATTPLVAWLYPPWYQRKLDLWKRGKIDWDGHPLPQEDTSESSEGDWAEHHEAVRKVLVYLRVDGLPGVFTIVSMLAAKREDPEQSGPLLKPEGGGVFKNEGALASVATIRRPVRVHGLRLMELTERDSSVMRVSEIEDYANRDPIIKAFGNFGQSHDVSVAGQVAVVPERSFSGTLMKRAKDLSSDFIVIPWSETGTMSEHPSLYDDHSGGPLANREFAKLVAETFEKARTSSSVGVLIDKLVISQAPKSESPVADRATWQLNRTNTGISVADVGKSVINFKLADSGRHRLIVLYTGGEDDLFAVKLGLQFAKNDSVDLKVIRPAVSKAADDENDNLFEYKTLRSSVPAQMQQRVQFVDSESPAIEAIKAALTEPSSAETLLVVGRSSADMSLSMISSYSSTAGQVLGSLATSAVATLKEKELNASLLVVQKRRHNGSDYPGELKKQPTNEVAD